MREGILRRNTSSVFEFACMCERAREREREWKREREREESSSATYSSTHKANHKVTHRAWISRIWPSPETQNHWISFYKTKRSVHRPSAVGAWSRPTEHSSPAAADWLLVEHQDWGPSYESRQRWEKERDLRHNQCMGRAYNIITYSRYNILQEKFLAKASKLVIRLQLRLSHTHCVISKTWGKIIVYLPTRATGQIDKNTCRMTEHNKCMDEPLILLSAYSRPKHTTV